MEKKPLLPLAVHTTASEAAAAAVVETEAGWLAGSTHRPTPILLCVYFFMEAVGRSDLYNEGRREVEATAAVCIKAE